MVILIKKSRNQKPNLIKIQLNSLKHQQSILTKNSFELFAKSAAESYMSNQNTKESI